LIVIDGRAFGKAGPRIRLVTIGSMALSGPAGTRVLEADLVIFSRQQGHQTGVLLMPYVKLYEGENVPEAPDVDDDGTAYEEFLSQLPFEYANPWEGGSLNIESLPAELRELCAAARSLGYTHFVVAYDGGSDEGFSYPSEFLKGDEHVELAKACPELNRVFPTLAMASADDAPRAPQSLGARLRGIFVPAPAPAARPSPSTAPTKPMARASARCEELAECVSVAIMGEGYGTGPYEMYGRAILDLQTGVIRDDPSAPKPSHPPGHLSSYPSTDNIDG
jgi:hypothetical protein